ncbi:Phthiotriol/phenolphthiotriol dimycocerosates methyltransferase [Mycobacterium talmoniae]|uniref:Phthiotriol/phenolphthiotriol dimycocerosates methyltransferase n=1 Tax=Mycobacterium talmoniae TaxID=1858794 RepID=A0A2S8BBM9_9MYCO|nr:Phthiotriol/phenolphthiotriol dimycocerosates methyltransferase [Mycobacterium talmoniae]
MLLAVAKRLPHGKAIGVDLWQADQTDNSEQATLANAALEQVLDRVEVHTADMTALPLADGSVDVVVSNLAIHNIPSRDGRRRALTEAVRVLRPGGRLVIADLWEIRNHAAQLRELGWRNVTQRNLGWRMWYGGPWAATRLVTATKPS